MMKGVDVVVAAQLGNTGKHQRRALVLGCFAVGHCSVVVPVLTVLNLVRTNRFFS
jgi:hypothetical protein